MHVLHGSGRLRLVACASAVALAKEHVPGCGGPSLLLELFNDGGWFDMFADPYVIGFFSEKCGDGK